MAIRRIKTLRSHTALAQLISEIDEDEPVGYLALCQIEPVTPTPCSGGAALPLWKWRGQIVFWVETAQRRYEVFEVPAEFLRFKTRDEALDWHLRYRPSKSA